MKVLHSFEETTEHLQIVKWICASWQQVEWKAYKLQYTNNYFRLEGATDSELVNISCINHTIQLEALQLGNYTFNEIELSKITSTFIDIYTKTKELNDDECDFYFTKFIAKHKSILNKEYAGDLLAYIFPEKPLYGTKILIGLNVLVFVIAAFLGAGIIDPTADDLNNLGANSTEGILNGEYWRWFSCIFLHFGIVHLLSNMIALWLTGTILESKIKTEKYLVNYFLCGILSSACSFYWHEYSVSAGASGAIFGNFGYLTAILILKHLPRHERLPLFLYLAYFVGSQFTPSINAVIGLDNTDHAAHISGYLFGIVIGILLQSINTKNVYKS